MLEQKLIYSAVDDHICRREVMSQEVNVRTQGHNGALK